VRCFIGAPPLPRQEPLGKVSVKPFQRLASREQSSRRLPQRAKSPYGVSFFEAQLAALLFFFAPYACKEKANKRLQFTKSRRLLHRCLRRVFVGAILLGMFCWGCFIGAPPPTPPRTF